MIYDNLDNLSQYTGLFEHLDTAIEYLQTADLHNLPLGRTDIDGDNVYVNIAQITPEKSEERPFEVHSRYMDIQIDLEGTELCEVALGDMTITKPYDPEGDALLCTCDTSAGLILGEGRFAIFMVEEAHKPNIMAQDCTSVKKAVVKVLY